MPQKQFTTYERQLEILSSEKHLTISNSADAIRILKKESYFALINGYKDLFKQPSNKSFYINGATFNDIYALYKFDESLRMIFLRYILVIERQLKSLISYEFCAKNGNKQCEYFNANNYRYSSENAEAINRFLGVLSSLYRKSKGHKYIEHYSNRHKNVPLWVLMNVLTFGQVSQMYQFMPDNIQVKVAKNFPDLRQNELESMLLFITFFRNVCAHNERLFNFTVSKYSIPTKYIHKYMKCTGKKGQNDLFALVICFKYLLDSEDFSLFAAELQGALAKYKGESDVLPQAQLLDRMGFPDSWRKVLKAPKHEPVNTYKKNLDSARIQK